jgi:FtsZ-binding cell division protein ZapB
MINGPDNDMKGIMIETEGTDHFQLLEERVGSLIKNISSLREEKESLVEKLNEQECQITDLTSDVEQLKEGRDKAKDRMVSLVEKIEQLDI